VLDCVTYIDLNCVFILVVSDMVSMIENVKSVARTM